MKKCKVFLCFLLALLLLAGCGQKEEEKKEDKQEETKTVVAVPKELEGFYYEEVAGKANLELKDNTVKIIWPDSYAKVLYWTMDVSYNEAEQKLEYEPAKCEKVTYNEKGEETERIVSRNTVEGYLEIGEEELILHDPGILGDMSRTASFRKGEIIPDEGTFTADLEEALKIAGIEFDPPIEESIPKTVSFSTYRAEADSVEAIYENEDSSVTLTVEKSRNDDETFTDLMKTYAQQWTENYKGLNVECAADKQQDDIHMALIKTADYFFRITYHSSDGHGLDVDELGSLVMGMQ